MIETLKSIIDWVQEKIGTTNGRYVLCFLGGTLLPFSFLYPNYQEQALLNKEISRLEQDVEMYKRQKEEWEVKALESNEACMMKMKEMFTFFNELESYYAGKGQVAKEKHKELQDQRETLLSIRNNL